MTDDDIEDIRILCPYCKKRFDAEDHNLVECFQASFRMITEANAKLEILEESRGLNTVDNVGDPDDVRLFNTRRYRKFRYIRYEVLDWLRFSDTFLRIIIGIYIILALLRFIEKGIN